MSYPVQKLLTQAWYLSGIVSRGEQTVSAQELSDGLDRLNALLSTSTSNTGLIPYFKQYDMNMISGQEKYYIPNLISIETATFYIGPVRYPLKYATREEYFAYSRVDSILTLPYTWHLETVNDGADVYFYYFPQENYPTVLWGKFQLLSVALNEDLSLTYQGFYIEYLTYKLAEYLCEYYNVTFPTSRANRLKSYEQSLRNVSPVDYTMRKLSVFQRGGAPDYAQENLGRGFYPI